MSPPPSEGNNASSGLAGCPPTRSLRIEAAEALPPVPDPPEPEHSGRR